MHLQMFVQLAAVVGVGALVTWWRFQRRAEERRAEERRRDQERLLAEDQQRRRELHQRREEERRARENDPEWQAEQAAAREQRRLWAERVAEQQRQHERQEQERRARQRAEQERLELWSMLATEVDTFIRTRRKFDSTHPTQYACQISTIECELRSPAASTFAQWRELLTESEEMFALSRDGQSVRLRHLTPFQGDSSHRVFGHFRCNCGKKWKSAATWKDKWQQCQACETRVYPHEQHVLERAVEGTEESERKPHDMARCQKCREKGSLCMPKMYYAV